MLMSKKKASGGTNHKGNRFLINVTVMGSAGPIRFVVKEEELVETVIDTALKSYAREGRLPVLGSDLNDFFLYCPDAADSSVAMGPRETIGSSGARNFMLYKKPPSTDGQTRSTKGSWKSWINKSLNLKIPSH